MRRKLFIIIVFVLSFPMTGYCELQCPDAPQQLGTDIEAEINSKANLLLKYIGTAELKGKATIVQKDFWHKYPHAAQLAVDFAFISAVCSGLRDDPYLTEQEKVNKLMEFRKQFVYRKQDVLSPPRSFLEQVSGSYRLIAWHEAHRPITLAFAAEHGNLTINVNGDAQWDVTIRQTYSNKPGRVRITAGGRVILSEKLLEGVPGGKLNNTHYLDNRWGQIDTKINLAVRGWSSGMNGDPFKLSLDESSTGVTELEMRNDFGTFIWQK